MKKLIAVVMCAVFMTAGASLAIAAEKVLWWDVHMTDFLKEIVDAAAGEFNKTADVSVEAVHLQNDPYKTKLKVVMGAGNPPDIFQSWGGGPLKEYVDSGMVEPVPEDVLEAVRDRFIPASFDPVTFDGETYCLPAAGLTGVYFWYRKDLFQENDITVPTTWKELLQVCETLKAKGIIPFALANKNKWTGSFYYMYLADRLGGKELFQNALYRKNGVTFADPAYIKAGEMIQELVKKGYFPEGVNGLDEDLSQASALLYTKKAGMYLMGTWFLSEAMRNYPDMMDQLDFFPFPAVEGGAGDPSNLIGSPGQDYACVTTSSENMDAAFEFLKTQVMNPAWVQAMASNGLVPPVKGASDLVTDPMLKKIARSFEAANGVQVYYDQFMPPAMGEVHKNSTQALFGLELSPEDVAKAHEEALQVELNQ
ncbi:ABC transporter substrate-binding protein [candidate division KSB3 bacterium]|uniref:ABC transporter substrate-binding protein n=1 Tax=candidate division KSB3 bacterium TaxID=2044937 RepID=A0A2G6EA42_9BACT|nr:MAG: ABC transporter substrate-binding protein [candidate division KSB3 bacterium]PIE29576.1 MAG: ABC transporter substrate-binding protein [candidate division KSB3 bacterium]